MTKKLTILLGFISLVVFGVTAVPSTENVLISNIQTTYKLKADKQGRLESARVSDRLVYQTRNYDDMAIAYASYGDNITIDKASAPGAKPQYSQIIGQDIFYEDHRVCLLKFDVKSGKSSIVEFERTIKDPAQICEITFGTLYDVVQYNVTIEVPAVLANKLTFTPVNFPADALMDRTVKSDGSVTYNYIMYGVNRLADEPLSPSPSLTRPFVRITGYFDDVNALYSYLSNFVTPEEPSDQIVALSRQITVNATTDIDKINAIATWVRQNIRYVAIEHGEYGQRPELAANVLANRYGDCKGSANLIKALLRAVSLDGRLVWIGTSDVINTDWQTVPTLATGNHMIAACLLDGQYKFIDGTIDYAPAGYVPTLIRGQSALIEDGDDFVVARVPNVTAEMDVDSITAHYTLGLNSILTGNITHAYGGLFARRYDGLYNSVTAANRQMFLNRLVADGKKSITVDDVRFERESPDSRFAYLHATITDANAVKRNGNRQLVSIALFEPNFAVTVDTATRTTPIKIPYPCRYVANIDVKIDDDILRIDVPKDVTLQSPWFDCQVRYSLNCNVITIAVELFTKELDASLDVLPEWNNAVRSLKKALNPVIKLNNPES